ncbi:MAG: hypothetical protein MUF73_05605 [Rhodobacteraceae bacterium]|jgi:hypothetical protein|nr:hypothetical protein [Paracoccaceae bacterium]
MGRAGALRLEYAIIGLGLFALVLIFQPFSRGLFAVGALLVVVAALINNLLPLARPGVAVRRVVWAGLIVGLVFCVALLVSIAAAYLYGVAFLAPPDPNTTSGRVQLAAAPFWRHPFVWSIAAAAVVFAGLLASVNWSRE